MVLLSGTGMDTPERAGVARAHEAPRERLESNRRMANLENYSSAEILSIEPSCGLRSRWAIVDSMKMILEKGDAASNRIRHYEPGQLTINDRVLETSVLVTPGTDLRDWPPATFEDLVPEHATPILDLEPEVVLLGTGPSQRFPEREIMLAFLERGIGIEVMDTASACRTYNILMAEDRRVVAALIIR
jgi:uncharacterized protein